MEYYSVIKSEGNLPLAATWMDLEIVTLSEGSQRQIPCDTVYMWDLKYGINEFIYKTEIESQM